MLGEEFEAEKLEEYTIGVSGSILKACDMIAAGLRIDPMLAGQSR